MWCYWLTSLRNLLLWFILNLQVLKHHWVTSDFSVSPELVCSNPWAPGGANPNDSCPALPTAVLCKAASSHACGSHIPWGRWEGGYRVGVKATFPLRLSKGKEHQPAESCPGAWPFPCKEAMALQILGKTSSLWPFFGSPLDFLYPTLVLKEQGHGVKLYDYTCSHFLQIL